MTKTAFFCKIKEKGKTVSEMQEQTNQEEVSCGLYKTAHLRSSSPEATINGRTYTDSLGAMCE